MLSSFFGALYISDFFFLEKFVLLSTSYLSQAVLQEGGRRKAVSSALSEVGEFA